MPDGARTQGPESPITQKNLCCGRRGGARAAEASAAGHRKRERVMQQVRPVERRRARPRFIAQPELLPAVPSGFIGDDGAYLGGGKAIRLGIGWN
jgi:hypothetical protein